MKIPECHPDRPHAGKGYCRPCYIQQPHVKETVRKCGEAWRHREENKERQLEYGRQRRQRLTKADKFAQELKYKYGLEVSQWEVLVARYNGACWICREIPEQYLCVDHSHETGRVRGMLCTRCNAGLGQFRDSSELLVKAQEYLYG